MLDRLHEYSLPFITNSECSLVRSISYGGSATSSMMGQAGQAHFQRSSHAVQEPNIDFELDVMVYFNSGKCVFHTREVVKDENQESSSSVKKTMNKEKSFTGLLDVNTNTTQTTPNQSGVPSPSPKTTHPRYHTRSLSGQLKNNSLAGLKVNLSSSKLKGSHSATQHSTDTTVFLIPGLDIKVLYNSRNESVELPMPAGSSTSFIGGPSPFSSRPTLLRGDPSDITINSTSTFPRRTVTTKKASCQAWMTLHCIPEETVITPHILDFLEQALEPLPIESPRSSTPSQEGQPQQPTSEEEDLMNANAPGQYAVYGSFPVDVVVYLHVQPSVLRFSCLPVSRVECLLQLPSVELTFSSKKSEDDGLENLMSPSAYEKSKSLPSRAVLPSKFSHRRIGSDYRPGGVGGQQILESSVGGMSMTGCLADFSLYIFHPYGGQQGKKATTTADQDQQAQSTASKFFSGRKDSLSLQVEYVKIDISRSRKIIFSIDTSSPKFTYGLADRQIQSQIIRFVGTCDVGSASFKYDMRRLSEILAFPKAWYRKAIWRRMFLGDESLRSTGGFTDSEAETDGDYPLSSDSETLDMFVDSIPAKDSPHRHKGKKEGSRKSTPEPTEKVRRNSFDQKTENATGTGKRDSLFLNLNQQQERKKSNDWKSFTPPIQLATGTSSKSNSLDRRQLANAPWETLVVFNLNLSKLNIQMNMGNVMGNTTWLSRGFRSEGRVSIDSAGHKGFIVKLKLDASSLDSKGGIVGGIIELSSIETELNVKEDRGKDPSHVLKLKLHTLQTRFDYMGTSVLMARVSDLDLTLRDEWRVDQAHAIRTAHDHPTKRPALIFIHSHLVWDQVQILMSKSTTPDITKICAKLDEFFTQQFHSSVRVLSSLEPSSKTLFNRSSFKNRAKISTSGRPSTGQQPGTPVSANDVPFGLLNVEARHHRHWQKVLRLVSGVTLSTLPNPLPLHGTILGGTVELTGKNISLACFYGINFRSKAWGLFSLRQPTISFATEAQDVMNEVEGMDTHIVQNLSVSLGRGHRESHQNTVTPAQHTTMATVCRVSRSVMFPPQFRRMHEWFQYAFASSELDEVTRFPVVEFERSGHDGSLIGPGDGSSPGIGLEGKRRISASPKSQEFHHNKEVIFALPSFQMELKTEHLQAPKTPSTSSPKPSVDCTFVTDFDDHIFVAVDAEAYFFLHELITSYIRERDTPYNKVPQTTTSASPTTDKKRKPSREDSGESLADWRDFFCHTWHLEPTVRLLSWAGKNIEPYGVDYILQRLGFSQARTTIPKWIQRGAMDPLDKILAVVMYRIIRANAIDPKSREQGGSK